MVAEAASEEGKLSSNSLNDLVLHWLSSATPICLLSTYCCYSVSHLTASSVEMEWQDSFFFYSILYSIIDLKKKVTP